MNETPQELREAYENVRKAQEKLEADRKAVREKIIASEPTWGPCLQCGHRWRSHNLRRRFGKPPRKCPKCLSIFWFDPEYIPRASRASAKVAEAEEAEEPRVAETETPPRAGSLPASTTATPPPRINDNGGDSMKPPPRFAPPQSVRFAEDSPEKKDDPSRS